MIRSVITYMLWVFILVSPQVVHADSAGTSDTVRQYSSTDSEGRSSSSPQRSYVLNVMRSVRGHMHNKSVHIPIGFSIAAFVLLIARRGKVDQGIRILVLLAAVGAIVSIFSGLQQSVVYDGGTKDWVIEVHERLGITTLVLLLIWTAVTWITALHRWALSLGILIMVAVVVTGFFGGVIAHG
jgi:uncharacterized membrane protein